MRLVIGFSPGSLSDRIARSLAPSFARALGEDVSVAPLPGGSGAVAARAVADARPDGGTLFMATLGTHALARHARRDLPYDPVADFAPVAGIADAPLLAACHPGLGIASVAELVRHAQRHPGELAYGTSALGGAPHLAAALFETRANVVLRHVRYDATQTLFEDLAAGRIGLSFNNLAGLVARCRSGALRALAVTAGARVSLAPEVPTLAECGIADCEVTNWCGLVAPGATPPDVVARLARAIRIALDDPALGEAWAAQGLTVLRTTPGSFGDHIAREIARWQPVAGRLAPPAEHRKTKEEA